MTSLEERERREISFWTTHDEETVHAGDPSNIALKLRELPVLLDCLDRYAPLLDSPARIVELGAGQGWVSCVLKHRCPDAKVIATDLSRRALVALRAWEHVFRVAIDGRYACRSYQIPEPSNSVDLVVAFAAAHHFGAHRRTLAELRRVLRPGGHALYLYEPACPRIWHSLARARVNRKRPDVPEDVLVVSELRALTREVGLQLRVDYDPSRVSRGALETIYYTILGTSGLLQRAFPCTANFVFEKS